MRMARADPPPEEILRAEIIRLLPRREQAREALEMLDRRIARLEAACLKAERRKDEHRT